MNKASRIANSPAVLGLLPAAFCLFSGVIDRLYVDIDSFLVSMTSHGLYGNDAICPVVHPLLAILLGHLSPLAPAVDWFALFSRFLVTLTAWWLGVMTAWCIGTPFKRIGCLLVFSTLLFRFSLLNANYTVHCAFFAMTGVCTLLLALRRPMPRFSVFWGAFFFCLAILWRPEGSALLIPFLALDFIVLLLRRSLQLPATKKVILPTLLPALLLVSFSVLLPLVSSSYAAGAAYSDARRSYVDYPKRPWSEVSSDVTALGLSENDYTTLSRSILMDTNVAVTPTLQELSGIAQKHDFSSSADTLHTLFADFLVAFSPLQLRVFALLTGVLLLGICLSGLPPLHKVEAVLSVLGALLIALYYLYRGRLPERLLLSIFLIQFSVLLPLFLTAPPAHRFSLPRFWKAFCFLSAACLCLLLVKNRYNYHVTQLAVTAGTTVAEDTALLPADTSDTIYVWDSMSLALYMTEHYMQPGKLPSTAFVRQNLAWGEWNTSGQPFYQHMLDEIQLTNPMQSLLTRPHTYLVSEDSSLIETWLQEHYDPSATLQQVGTVDVFALGPVPIWQAVTN